MQRSGRHLARLCWSLTLGLTILLLATEKAGAQYPIYGFGYGYPGMGYGYPGMGYGFAGMGYGYPGMGYGYPGMGYGYPGMGYGFAGMGYGYPGYGYGPGAGLAYPGAVYGFGYPGPYAWGYRNPLFGVGLSPLGVQSYLYETRVLGRVPRSSASYYSAASRRY